MEIERKFLIKRPIENYKDYPCREIEQAYLSLEPEIRVRRDNNDYYLTYKSNGELSREEYNLLLTQDSYNRLLQKSDGNIISKKRYMIPIEGSELVVELDIFEGKFDGLILAEVEFETVYDANNFNPPSWFGKEVTCDDSYKNKNLSKTQGEIYG